MKGLRMRVWLLRLRQWLRIDLNFLTRLRCAWYGVPYLAGGVDVAEMNVTTVTELDNAIPEKWIAELRADSERATFWGPTFEGTEGSGKPIIRRDDFTREPGDTIRIQTFRALARPGVTGNTTLTGSEETLALGQFTLTAEWLRHAVSFNRRATRRAVFNAAKVSQKALAKWLAKAIDDDMDERLIVTETPTTLQAGNAAAVANLGASNVFTPDEIDRCKYTLMSLGALPFDVLMDNGQERPMFGIVISEASEYQLKSNTTWNQAQRDAGIRGERNKLFTGALGVYNGVIIYVATNVQSGTRKWGSFKRPQARVNGTHTAAITTITVGGSDTTVDYAEYFPATGSLHVRNANGTEIMTYSANSNTTFTVTRGQQGTTAVALVDGDILTLASNSVERERVLCFGSEMAVRTWAVLPQMQNELQDYRFKFGIGIEAAYGQVAVVDSRSTIPNYVLLNVAAPRP